jgi:hypothetical protein
MIALVNASSFQYTTAYMKMVRLKSVDYDFHITRNNFVDISIPTTIDNKIVVLGFDDNLWPKKTPWSPPERYGTSYEITCNAFLFHPIFNINLKNDETGEFHDFCVVVCGLELLTNNNLRDMIVPVYETFLEQMSLRNSESSPQKVKHLLVSKFLLNDIVNKGLAVFDPSSMTGDPDYLEWCCSRFAPAQNVDVKPMTTVITALLKNIPKVIPITETFVGKISTFPCNRCSIAIESLRKKGMIKPDTVLTPEMWTLMDRMDEEVSEWVIKHRK